MAGPISNVKYLCERQASVVRGSLVAVGPRLLENQIWGIIRIIQVCLGLDRFGVQI